MLGTMRHVRLRPHVWLLPHSHTKCLLWYLAHCMCSANIISLPSNPPCHPLPVPADREENRASLARGSLRSREKGTGYGAGEGGVLGQVSYFSLVRSTGGLALPPHPLRSLPSFAPHVLHGSDAGAPARVSLSATTLLPSRGSQPGQGHTPGQGRARHQSLLY